mgnify:CR=1 FL=1
MSVCNLVNLHLPLAVEAELEPPRARGVVDGRGGAGRADVDGAAERLLKGELRDEPGPVQNTPCSELPPCPLFHSAVHRPFFTSVQKPPFFHTFHSSPSSSRTVGAYWIEMLSPTRSTLISPRFLLAATPGPASSSASCLLVAPG